MSSNLAYLAYEAMTSGINSVSIYILDTNNNQHNVGILVPSTGIYYYFDSSESEYTASSLNVVVNGNTILSIPLNNAQKTVDNTIFVVVTVNVAIDLPGSLGTLVTQAIEGIFAGLQMNLGCSATVYYIVANVKNGQSTQGSTGLSFNLVSDSVFTASGSISFGQYEVVTVTKIVISCSYGNVQQDILSSILKSGECQSSSGCTYNITVSFSS